MNNNNIYSPYSQNDPNKKKKCSCEDKHGPKPFTSTPQPKQTSSFKND